MRPHPPAALLIFALLLGCAGGAPPAPAAGPPPEILVLGLPGGAHQVIQSRDGRDLANLPAGLLAARLNGGGDIGEAYLVSLAGDGAAIAALQPSRAYSLAEVAQQPGAPLAAVLAVAPGLTSFVGPQTVLAVLDAGGRLTGYQHGSRVWSTPIPGPSPRLRLAGDLVFAGSRGSWSPVTLRDGTLGAALPGAPCQPGPVAVEGGRVVQDCSGQLLPGSTPVPGGEPAVLPAGGARLLYFPEGELWKLAGGSARRVGSARAWTAPPAISPDGRSIYVATPEGIDEVNAATAARRPLVRQGGVTSIALSRDGNFVYALAGGHLYTFDGGGRQVSAVAAPGNLIEVVAGG